MSYRHFSTLYNARQEKSGGAAAATARPSHKKVKKAIKHFKYYLQVLFFMV